MKLKQAYITSDSWQCYNEAIIYRIVKYARANATYKIEFVDKYLNALCTAKKEDINIDFALDLDDLKRTLIEKQKYIEEVKTYNKPFIENYGEKIEKIILNSITDDMNEYDKVMFLVQYAVSNLSFSKEYFQYCINAPLGDGLDFDFKNGIPTDKSKNGMLVIGQGLSGDISNLISYLGNKLDLDIDRNSTTYRDNSYSFNVITFSDGVQSCLDITGIIEGDKTIDQCLLVSGKVLDEKGQFNNEFNSNSTFISNNDIDLSQTETLPRCTILSSYIKTKNNIDGINQLIKYIKYDAYGYDSNYLKGKQKIR